MCRKICDQMIGACCCPCSCLAKKETEGAIKSNSFPNLASKENERDKNNYTCLSFTSAILHPHQNESCLIMKTILKACLNDTVTCKGEAILWRTGTSVGEDEGDTCARLFTFPLQVAAALVHAHTWSHLLTPPTSSNTPAYICT